MKDFLIFLRSFFHAFFMHNLLRILKLTKQPKNFFSANSKHFSIGRMKILRVVWFIIWGRRTGFHYGNLDLRPGTSKTRFWHAHGNYNYKDFVKNQVELIQNGCYQNRYTSWFWANFAFRAPNRDFHNEILFSDSDLLM